MARQNYRDLTHEQLVALLEARDRKKFGLVWEQDAIEHDRALNSDFVALDEVPELGAGNGTKENLIIEGDNFDALRALKVAYAGKVKCIYIDPPYNTGNRDFVYNDRFVEKDHSWRHSMWLEFMFQRTGEEPLPGRVPPAGGERDIRLRQHTGHGRKFRLSADAADSDESGDTPD
jgi:adenine-specific DNA-methyltransferase